MSGLVLNAAYTFFYQREYGANAAAGLDVANTAWYYSLAKIGDIVITVAGALAFGKYRKYFPRFVNMSFILMVILVTAASWGDLSKLVKSPSLFYGPKGIGTYFNFSILYMIANEKYLSKIFRFFYVLCFLYAFVALIQIISLGSISVRDDVLNAIREYAIYLIWVFPFFLLRREKIRSVQIANYVLLFFTIIFTVGIGSRAYLADMLLVVMLKVWLEISSAANKVLFIVVGSIFLLVGYFVFINSQFFSTFEKLANIFTGRVRDDTRSDQLRDFLQQFDLNYLYTGVGPTKTWFWTQIGEDYGYLDNQFLLIVWWAGLPVGILYFLFLVYSLIKRVKAGISQYLINGARVSIGLWILACAGFAVYATVSSNLYYYFISLLIGLLTIKKPIVFNE